MSRLQKTREKDYTLYYYDKMHLPLLQKVVARDYTLVQNIALKASANTQIISIESKKYVLKEINDLPLLKKFLSLFRKSHCLEVLVNTNTYINRGFVEIGNVYGIGEIRTFFVKKQFLLMEYIEGRILEHAHDFKIVEDFLFKLHKANRYHGDVHAQNFLIDTNNNLRVLDTRLKSNLFGNIGGHLDMHKFRRTFGEQSPYPYKKNIFYLYCLLRERKKILVDQRKLKKNNSSSTVK